MDTLVDPEGHDGSGEPITGWSGTQGVKCFDPDKGKRQREEPSIEPRKSRSDFVGEAKLRRKMIPGGNGLYPAEYRTLYFDTENMRHYYDDAQGVRRYTDVPSTPIDEIRMIRRLPDNTKLHPRGRVLDFPRPASSSSDSELDASDLDLDEFGPPLPYPTSSSDSELDASDLDLDEFGPPLPHPTSEGL
jgi:hypothetical protein